MGVIQDQQRSDRQRGGGAGRGISLGDIGDALADQREQNRQNGSLWEAAMERRENAPSRTNGGTPAGGAGNSPAPTARPAPGSMSGGGGQSSAMGQLDQYMQGTPTPGAGRAGSGGGSTPFPQNRNTPQQSGEIPMGGGIRMGRGAQGEPAFNKAMAQGGSGNDRYAGIGGADVTARFNQAADTYARMNQQARSGPAGRPQVNIPTNPLQQGNQQAYKQLQRELLSGISTDMRGQRLTADGVKALTGAMGELSGQMSDYDMGGLDAQTKLGMQQMRNQGDAEQQQLRNQGTLDNTQAQIQGNMSRDRQQSALGVGAAFATGDAQQNLLAAERMRESGVEPIGQIQVTDNMNSAQVDDTHLYNTVHVPEANALLAQMLNETGSVPSAAAELSNMFADLNDDLQSGTLAEDQLPEVQTRRQQVMMALQQLLPSVQGYAEGGLVSAAGPGGLMRDPAQAGNVDPMARSAPSANPVVGQMAMQGYQQYLQMARKMGLPPVEFEQFMQMQAQQGQAPGTPTMPEMQQGAPAAGEVMGFAEGGPIPEMGGALAGMGGPQVDGQMVVDPDPNAPADSIPAMVDGQQPAALDSGELVFPKDVVLYYGTQKLMQMIEKARSGGASPKQPRESGAQEAPRIQQGM